MPDSLELPRVLRAVVPLVSAGDAVVDELVAVAFGHAVGCSRRLAGRCARLYPSLAAIIGALNDLSEPGAGLRRVESVRINRRPLDVINFPTRKVRPADLPSFALAVRGQDERAL